IAYRWFEDFGIVDDTAGEIGDVRGECRDRCQKQASNDNRVKSGAGRTRVGGVLDHAPRDSMGRSANTFAPPLSQRQPFSTSNASSAARPAASASLARSARIDGSIGSTTCRHSLAATRSRYPVSGQTTTTRSYWLARISTALRSLVAKSSRSRNNACAYWRTSVR